jgi:uncharacterized protein (DUF58 family)
VIALVASRGFGTTALAVLGVGLVALPVLVTGLVWAVAPGVRLERRIAPARCRAGDPVRVTLSLSGWAARAGLVRLLDLSLDPGLGTARGPRAPAREGARTWRVPAAPRGDHALPPPRLRIADPFGLARRVRSGDGDDRLLVVPRAPALERLALGTGSPGRGPRRRRPLVGFGELDRIRDYQAGDPLSRVHWAQTAKRGRLQTKVLRAAEGSGRSVMVLVDGAAPAGSDLETAVTAAAAVARHVAERGEPLGLSHTGRHPARIAVGRATRAETELALARLEPGGERALPLALRAEATAPDPPDLLVVATSAGDPGLAAATAQALGAGVGVAVILAGPAAAGAGELARAGAEVAIVAGPDDVAAALGAGGARARVS